MGLIGVVANLGRASFDLDNHGPGKPPMPQVYLISVGLLVLAFVSGMLGLGVAFAAIPYLGLFLPDLVHQVQPLALLLNGATALCAMFGFARSGFVDWRRAVILTVVTTSAAPLGAYLAHFIGQVYIWWVYLASVLYLSYRLFKPLKEREGEENFLLAAVLAVPISVLAGFLGVGPGFLLMPTLILVGFEAKKAAGINAFAVTLPSFSAFLPHLATARLDWHLTGVLILIGALSAFIGARVTSLYVPSVRLKQLFGLLIVVMTGYKIFTLLG